MLTIFANALKTATRTRDWDAPQHWKGPSRHPMSQRKVDEAEKLRQRLHYRSLW